MQYWMQEQVTASFETWFKTQVQHLPSGAGLRVQYHEQMQTAMQDGIDGKSGFCRSQDMSGVRMASSRDRAELTRVHIARMQQEAQARCRPEAVQYLHNQPFAQQMPRTRGKAQAKTATSEAPPSGGPRKDRRPGRPNLHADKKSMNGHRPNTDTDCFQMLTNQHKLSSKGACIDSATNSIDARAKTEKDQPHQSHQSTLLNWLGPKLGQADKPTLQESTKNDKTHTVLSEHQQDSSPRQKGVQSSEPAIPALQTGIQLRNTQKQHQQEADLQQRAATETQQYASTACKRPRTERQQSAQYRDFTILTHNLMGMTTVLEETALTAAEHTPDVMVYTETKVTNENKNQLDKHLANYGLYHSCKASLKNNKCKSGKEKSRAGSAGVTIAVHTDLLTQNSVSLIRIQNPIAKGHCKAVKIQPPGSDCILVWGVYVPHDTNDRQKVYDMLREEVPKATSQIRLTGCKCVSIMAGDWNAALLEGDKTTMDGADEAHQELMSELHMQPTEHNIHQQRQATHHPVADNTPASRIDDILMSHDLVPNTFPHTEVLCGTGDSDHSTLMAKIPLEKVLLLKPGPDKPLLPAPQKLKTPVAAAQLAAFKETFAIQTAELTQDLNADLDMLLELADEIRADNPECRKTASHHVHG